MYKVCCPADHVCGDAQIPVREHLFLSLQTVNKWIQPVERVTKTSIELVLNISVAQATLNQ